MSKRAFAFAAVTTLSLSACGSVESEPVIPAGVQLTLPAVEIEPIYEDSHAIQTINEPATVYAQAERLSPPTTTANVLLPGEVFCGPFDDYHRSQEVVNENGSLKTLYVCWA
jgi:hypothetical protein